MLYLVPTPIGNLGDITERAKEVLGYSDYILAEDTRVSKKLLDHLGLSKTIKSYHAHNEHKLIDQIIEDLKSEKTISLISDAGTPGISDPGFLIVRACHANSLKVSCLPGATALIPAIVVSGLPSDKFFFEGFLPQKKGRQTRLQFLATLPHTFVLYESPHRLIKCLSQLIDNCGPRRLACVTREISKIYEEVQTGSLESLYHIFNQRTKIKGEIVIVVSAIEASEE